MGTGRFKDGKFDLVVVANFLMTATDFTEWKRSFEKSSELFWDASEGQLQYGRIFVCDENVGADTAEVILHESGDPSYATSGGFGQPGKALHLMPYVKFEVLTNLHEMGHHVWALGEEYAAAPAFDDIDTSSPAPDNLTIPLVNSIFAPGTLVGARAILKFPGDVLERKAITGHTATSVTVGSAFSQLPTDDTNGEVQYQFDAECATAANANFCIMENSRDAAGELDAAGTWTPAANPVTEFCSDSNHDPDGNTHQETKNADSCWETIVTRDGFTSLTAPDPAASGPAAGFTAPEWVVLDKQPRFALMIDRSGSMSQGHKMADVRHGAVYWLEFCGIATDLLTIVDYDDQIDTLLSLTEVSTLGGLQPTIDAIDNLTPRGRTNIRDAMFEAQDQIETPATRAAVQVALLMTDGIHNSPAGSSPIEAIPDYQEAGIRLYTLGVGQPTAVDMTTLDELATETGGRSFAVGDDQAGVIENAMIEINAEVRGGIITTEPVLFPDCRAGAMDKLIAPVVERSKGRVPPRRRPSLDKILGASAVKSAASQLRRAKRKSNRVAVIPVDVERDADRASFAMTHPESVDVWLYLIDPSGNVVDPASAGVHHVASQAPHEFIVVERPDPGRWLVVAVRVAAGAAFRAGFVAGGENRNLQVFATAPPSVAPGSDVPFEASARWLHELSGLKISARVIAPSGASQTIGFNDDASGRPSSGHYRSTYTPTELGRHRALVTVGRSPATTIADPMGRLLHSENSVVETDPGAPRFVRQVVVNFEVGRPEKLDATEERPSKRRPRPTKLVSAKRRRLKIGAKAG